MININTLNSEQEINVNQVDGIASIEIKGNILSITYESLKTLRDSSKLVPGQQYRIIDYITGTSQENTQSAGHQFDIIVTALDECTLSEEAQAIQNINDSYFDNSNLSAWKLWYCLDNDTNRFAWAGDVKVGEIEHKKYDSSKCTINPELINGNAFITPFNFESCVWVDGNSDGLAYSDDHINHDISELVYEWGYFTDENDDIQLCLYKSEAGYYEKEGQPDYGDKYLYRGVVNVDGSEYDYWQKWDVSGDGGVYINGGDDYVYATTQRIVSNPEVYSVTIETEDIYQPGKGVIYRMIDEWNNDVPYDFKNIQFKRYKITSSTVSDLVGKYASSDTDDVTVDTNTPYWCYTFSTDSLGDASLNENSKFVHNNVISGYYYGFNVLNDIVFIGTITTGNRFGVLCSSITFGDGCQSNTFIGCSNSIFGNDCSYNIFGDNGVSNIFGNNCSSNIFGNGCQSNTIGSHFQSNTIGNDFQDNTFGNDYYRNTFGNYCQYNSFGNDYNRNTFGNGCQYNTFGNHCGGNTFGNDCCNIKFASDSSASTKYEYYKNNHFGDGCQYILFKGVDTASPSNQVQNYNFAQGLQGNASIYLTIEGIRNLSYEVKVAKNSKGEIKIYCEADLIA